MGDPARGRRRLAATRPSGCMPNGGRRASRARQEIDASIAAKADVEYLYDKPYRGQEARPRRRPVHGREPVAAPRAAGRRERRADRRAAADGRRPRAAATPQPTSPRWCSRISQPPACSRAHEERPHQLHRAHALARRLHRRRRPLPGGRRRERRAGILIGPEFGTVAAPRPRRRRARGRRGPLRRADRLRLQLRRPRLRARPSSAAADPQGADEPRPAHGRRAEEHRQGQPLRRVRRARHRRSATPDGDADRR